MASSFSRSSGLAGTRTWTLKPGEGGPAEPGRIGVASWGVRKAAGPVIGQPVSVCQYYTLLFNTKKIKRVVCRRICENVAKERIYKKTKVFYLVTQRDSQMLDKMLDGIRI
jgi:hypothetical protein